MDIRKCYYKGDGGDGIPAKLFQILEDNAVKVQCSVCQQIWKALQWPQNWKRSVFIPMPKKGNAKECSNCLRLVLISHASQSETDGLKLNIQKTKIMASGPITACQRDGEKVERLTDLIFFSSKSLQMLTVAIKLRHFLLRRKAMINPESILKSRDITLQIKVCIDKAMVFPVVMYECELDHKKGQAPKN